MDHQATLNGSHRPARDLREHVGGLGRNLVRMAELQGKLLAADARNSRARLLCTAGCWLAAVLAVIALLPVALAGAGVWLAEVTELSLAGGLLCAAGAMAGVALLLAIVGWVQFVRQRAAWEHSLHELRANLHAVREAFFQENEIGS